MVAAASSVPVTVRALELVWNTAVRVSVDDITCHTPIRQGRPVSHGHRSLPTHLGGQPCQDRLPARAPPLTAG